MPLPISTNCQARLFGLAASLGEIRSEALRHNNLDKAGLIALGRDIIDLGVDCEAVVLNQCAAMASEALLAIATAHQGPEGDKEANEKRMGYLTPALIGMLQCIMDNYHLTVDYSDEGPYTDWPTGDYGWLQWLEPNRKAIR